jgi:ribosomal protein S12 methylthiotransferase accessory factor
LARLEFLLDAPWGDEDLPSVLATGDAQADLALCLQRLASAGMQAYCVDLTVPEVAACGFCVVRVLITGTQHLAPGPFRFLSNPRLYRMPRQLGYTDHDTRPDKLNPFPHPFP